MKNQTAIGTRQHLVTVQDPGPAVPDGDGGYTQSWTSLVPRTWQVKIAPATDRDLERVAAGAVVASATHIVSGPYRADVSEVTRIIFRGRIFAITGVNNLEERNIETVCTCVELLGATLVNDFAWTQPGWISADPAWVQEGTF